MNTDSPKSNRTFASAALALTGGWIIFSTVCVISGQVLSLFGALNRTWYLVVLIFAVLLSSWPLWRFIRRGFRGKLIPRKRFKSIFPLLYLACLTLVFVGGIAYPPTNYDAFCYRIPRMLHWLDAGKYHWIGGFSPRMDFSSLGFEWLMLPAFSVFRTLRLAFLNNAFSYLLMPGLIYSAFRGLGIKGSVAATWMWIIPCGSCFVMEAGGIGNDFTATVYVLAGIVFALKARESGRRLPLVLALLSGALATCAKVSNLPLLLPLGICILAALARHRRLVIPGAAASVLALTVSFAPLAMMNVKHTGYWTGSPHNVQELKKPTIGLVGNSIQLGINSLVPAVFPWASSWNEWVWQEPVKSQLIAIRKDFPEINLRLLEMASEESSGMGMGVSASLGIALLAALRKFRAPNFRHLGFWVAAGFWIALVVVMAKLGNPCVPRIIACYYPGVMVLPLLLVDTAGITRNRIWRVSATVLLLPIIPALIFSPARPILRLDELAKWLTGKTPSRTERLFLVYDIYSKRSDEHAVLRNLLPANAKTIGFAGTDGDSEYSFWLPLGERRVCDFTPLPDKKLPDPRGLDAIVTSYWGCEDRFGIPPEEMAQALGWKIVASVPIRRMASFGEVEWYVLVPGETVPPTGSDGSVN